MVYSRRSPCVGCAKKGVCTVLFRKRRRNPPPVIREIRPAKPDEAGLVLISFDDMLKGSVFMRGRKRIRQCCVTVNGASRLVTSGDRVDRKTYEALLAAGAVRKNEEAAASAGAASQEQSMAG